MDREMRSHNIGVKKTKKIEAKKRKHKNCTINEASSTNNVKAESIQELGTLASEDEIIKIPQISKLKKKPRRKSLDETCRKNKKIKFSENDEVIQSKSKEPNPKPLNDDDAEVNDEDIDKFCEELDEEDNEQYESWIKLIEATLSSNKKKK